MADGAVTFRGNSTITRTRAVRPARRNHSRARTWSTRLVLALALARVFDVVSTRARTRARAGECAHDMRTPAHTRAYERQEQQQQQSEQDS